MKNQMKKFIYEAVHDDGQAKPSITGTFLYYVFLTICVLGGIDLLFAIILYFYGDSLWFREHEQLYEWYQELHRYIDSFYEK